MTIKSTCAFIALAATLTPAAMAASGPDFPLFGDVNDDCVVDIDDMKTVNKLIGTKIKFDKGDLNGNGGIDVEDYFLINVSVGSTCGNRLVGDVDGSGIVDATDFSTILGNFKSGDEASDINGDMRVNNADLELLEANWGATLGRRLLGDVNGDNVVDTEDLSQVLGDWGKGASPADMNGDNAVDDFELAIVRARFGMTAGRQLVGDVDGNLKVNHIDSLLVRGAKGTYLTQFDVDGNGKVNQADYDIVIANDETIASDSLSGDVNGDWVVDDIDLDIVQAQWGSSYIQADVDGDGVVGVLDQSVILGEYGNTFGQERLGDIDGNGVLNGSDLAILKAAWGTSFEPADLNADGTVDASDLGLYLGAPRARCGTPEGGVKPIGAGKLSKATKKEPSSAKKGGKATSMR
jgi:hypothetical protein